MKQKELKAEIDRIISMSGDNEGAHIDEDMLHGKVIKAFCPKWVVKEIDRLSKAEFTRWYS